MSGPAARGQQNDMDMSEQAKIGRSGLRGELRHDEPMARHVSWRAGGCARRSYAPADLEDMAAFLRGLPGDEPVCVVGLGSNLLVRDGGFDGTVIFTHWALRDLQVARAADGGGEIRAQAGVAAPKVARAAALNNLAGAEFLAGIPGTVGGALVMNAGCYGGETWNIVTGVETVDRTGVLRRRTPAHYNIGYRSVERRCRQMSQVSGAARGGGHAEEWFVSAVFSLPRGDGARSRARIKELLSQRIASQPLGESNAGSVFRNPPGDHAARLIEACGLKGKTVGGAEISAKHANFIVNTGGATAADIEALIALAQQAVAQRFGIRLEREVRVIGEPA
ncbi:MAG: UDP-N-acetylmuramate dehydrogenase [Burkholderiales bacterium]|nr:UDP-N-acetylmuramate dehydrogenase [Burkholderiales bacterium]